MNQFAQSAKFSDQLSTMPDQMLPRLAQQYKNDAITLSLILSEKNRRERMRGAASAQQAAQPQPKVNDAVVASMEMPENVGIGALPAPNIAQMNGGGLVSFADGGDVAQALMRNISPETGFVGNAGVSKLSNAELAAAYNKAVQSGMADRAQAIKTELEYRSGAMKKYSAAYAEGGDVDRYSSVGRVEGVAPTLIAQYQKELEEMGYGQRMQFSPEVRAVKSQIEGAKQASYLQQEQQRMLSGGRDLVRGAPAAAPTTAAAPAAPAQTGPTAQEMAQFDAATNLYMTERAARQAATQGNKPPAAPPAGPRPPAPAAQPPVDALAQYKADIAQFKPAAAKTPEQLLAEQKALIPEKYRGEAYAGLERSLQADAAAAGKEKDQSFWMSVMQAGLSAASGSSPYALKNIAEGMNVGLSSYKDSLAQFKKAEKERQKAMADIEQARRSEARGDADAALKARDRADERMDRFNGYAMQGIASLRGVDMSERGQTARTSATIAATLSSPERVVFNSLLKKHNNDAGAAYAEMTSMKREPMSRDAALKTWASDMMIQQKYPNFEDYFRMAQGPATGTGQLNPTDAALVNKYLSPPR